MNYVQQITDAPRQKMTLILPDGSQLSMVLEFKAQQYGWFITTLTYGSFVRTGIRIFTSPNILRQFKNQIPFGIGIFVDGNQEPTLISDFKSGRAQMAILTAAEVIDWEAYLSGQVST